MAHEHETSFTVKEPAWHGLSKVLDNPPTVREGIIAAGLDWQVLERPVFFEEQVSEEVATKMAYIPGATPSKVLIPGKKALVRNTDNKFLSVVSDKYRPLQNIEAFDFFDSFLQQGVAALESAGSLMEGKRVWVLAKITDMVEDVVPDDKVEAYLLLSNGHDGKVAVRVMFTPIRVVCWNTLSAAEANADRGLSQSVRIIHSGNLKASMKVVEKAIDTAHQTFNFTIEDYRAMARKDISVDGLKRYVRAVFDIPEEVTEMPRAFEMIEAGFDNGPGARIANVHGTVWGAYNAVTNWVDHQRGRTEESRLAATWFQPSVGPLFRKRAHTAAMDMVEGSLLN